MKQSLITFRDLVSQLKLKYTVLYPLLQSPMVCKIWVWAAGLVAVAVVERFLRRVNIGTIRRDKNKRWSLQICREVSVCCREVTVSGG